MEVDYVMAFVDDGGDELGSVVIRNLQDLKKHADRIRQLDIFLKEGNETSMVIRFTEKGVHAVRPAPVKF